MLTLPGVFAPISDSWQLADAVRREPLLAGSTALDLCTGSGVVAVAAAERGASVTAVDVSRRALLATWWNARRNGTRVRLRRGRLFAPVAGERFDLISANPPYVPADGEALPTHGPERAWAAGPDGRAVLDRICDEAPGHLWPGGVLLVVHSSLIDVDATVERMVAAGLVGVRVTDRRVGPLGPLMREQQRAGRIDPDVTEEAVVVVRGVNPSRSSSSAPHRTRR
ncbi:MAG: methyltransferase [Acidimicrobiales bacterium]|nr:methyltransferase [Acidimicrobiales bacterium]